MGIQTKLFSYKTFDNNLVATRKNKVTLTFNKPAYIGISILELSKLLMYEFHYDWIKNKCGNNSKPLFGDTDSLIYEIKTEDVNEDFSNGKEISGFGNYSIQAKYYDNSNKLVVGKMKDETAGVDIEEFFRSKSEMYLRLNKKTKGVNKNVVATIIHNECKDGLFNKKCLRHLMNRIQSKDHKRGTYEINKISFSCFDDKIYIQSNGYDGSALGF